MDELHTQISIQKRRFLMIQNAAEDASETSSGDISRHLISTRLEVLEANWSKFQSNHDRICETGLDTIDERSYLQHRIYERCQEFYVQAKAALLNQQESIETSHSSRTSEAYMVNRRRTLPKLDLPKFSGDYNEWSSFHDLFRSLVGENDEIPNVEKMQYLKTCLTGDAARLISNLRVSDTTFSIAWQALIKRFENKRVLISTQMDLLFSLRPIKSKSAKELNTVLAKTTEALGALEALGCHTRSWDPFLIPLLCRLLDNETREDWEVHLGTTTTFPTFKQFEEFLIGHTRAWERLEMSTSKLHKDKRRIGIDIKSEVKSRSLFAMTPAAGSSAGCRLCKSAHPLYACPIYQSQSSEQRRRTIIRLSLCFNCLGGHTSSQCSSSRRCKKCGKRHHTSIHDEFKSHVKCARADSRVSSANTNTSTSPPSASTLS